MTASLRTGVIMIALTIVAAGFGGWFGVQYGLAHPSNRSDLDHLLHQELDLSAEQNRQIETLEADFAVRRKSLDDEMRAANRELAEALVVRHAYDQPARKAIERFHDAMRALQEATIMHVLAMRAVLTPEQAKEFDSTVHRELVVGPS